jgi:hypothetical protein
MSKNKNSGKNKKSSLNSKIKALVEAEVEALNWNQKYRNETGEPFVDVRKNVKLMKEIEDRMTMTHGQFDKKYIKDLLKKKSGNKK